MNIPTDNFILLSYINTKLRDRYKDLDSLCEDLEIDKKELIQRLRSIGYEYDYVNNKFW